MNEFKMDWNKIKIESVWDAVNHYNHPVDQVRSRAQDYLLDYFHWDLVNKYNEDKPEDEQYKWEYYNDRFLQRAIDHLNYLFQKD